MKIFFTWVATVIFTLILCSCTITNIDTAMAPPEDYWQKPGVTKEATKIFLYRNCRYLDRPKLEDYPNKSVYEDAYEKKVIEIEQCMLDSQFQFTLKGSATPGTKIWVDICNNTPPEKSPACKSLRK
jgi:hypothetical protein